MAVTDGKSLRAMMEAAAEAAKAGQWTVAAQEWGRVCAVQPEHHGELAHWINSLAAAGQLDLAETEASASLRRLPDAAPVHVAWARLCDRQGDWSTALERWNEVFQRFPNHEAAFAGTLGALRETHRHEDAEHALRLHSERFTNCRDVAVAAALLASKRRDWPLALTRWRTVLEGCPS